MKTTQHLKKPTSSRWKSKTFLPCFGGCLRTWSAMLLVIAVLLYGALFSSLTELYQKEEDDTHSQQNRQAEMMGTITTKVSDTSKTITSQRQQRQKEAHSEMIGTIAKSMKMEKTSANRETLKGANQDANALDKKVAIDVHNKDDTPETKPPMKDTAQKTELPRQITPIQDETKDNSRRDKGEEDSQPKDDKQASDTKQEHPKTEASNDQNDDNNDQQAKSDDDPDTRRRDAYQKWNQPTEADLAALQQCFPLNSKEWLQGPRHGNIRDSLMKDDFVSNMIFFAQQDHAPFQPDSVLQQSMCLTQSRFLNASDALTDNRSMELWIVRLTYMAMHKVQHQFAIPEAEHRLAHHKQTQQSESTSSQQQQHCQSLADQYQIGSYDYECPNGKFFVVAIENLGLGAVIRTTVLSGLLAALATNRTVLFSNHAPVGPKPILQPWYHASCDRQDVQCFFHPPTPCVLSYQQLENAPVMKEFRNITKLFKNPGRLMTEDDWFEQEQTIVLPLKTVTRRVPKTIPDILRNFTLRVISQLDKDDARRAVLEQVAQRFVSRVYRDKVYQLISYGLVIYAMRPHLQSQQQLQQVMDKIAPLSKRHPEATLGLPIRASDKCVEESECLTFEQYMRVLKQIWNRHKSNLTQAMQDASLDKLDIVLTTESASVMEEKDAFMADAQHVKKLIPFDFEFITNEFDIKQDSGNPQNNRPEHNLELKEGENNADQVMLSMVSSLQAQLLARYSIGNCCSNFHRILFELLDGGCGAAYQSGPECLQKNEDPEFRICCLWDNSEECKAKNVKEKIEKKWKAVKRKRMQERQRQKQARQQSMVKGE